MSGRRVAATHMSWAHVHAGSTPATRTISPPCCARGDDELQIRIIRRCFWESQRRTNPPRIWGIGCPGIVGELVQIPLQAWEVGYSKDEELEADREGLHLAVLGGYSPYGAMTLFQSFNEL